MSVIIDGYKLWSVKDVVGNCHNVAAYNRTHLIERAKLRNLEIDERTIGWNCMYGSFFESGAVKRGLIEEELALAIYNDVSNHP